ncbi:MAG: hypothetical protein PHR35_22925 [Kiritimatiellae bacterium]|nr:hypothetical protein [Kiritimatiellia bacterium]
MIHCHNCQAPLAPSDVLGGSLCRYCGNLAYGPVLLANRWYQGTNKPRDLGVYLWIEDCCCYTMQWDSRGWHDDHGKLVNKLPELWAGPVRWPE